MALRRVSGRTCVLAACLAIGACSQAPFDATAPWQPTTGSSNASYAGGMLGSRPRPGFDLFESQPPQAPEEPVSLPRAGGENPWATEARNVVVTVCYGRLANTVNEVRQAAQELCPDDSTATYIGQDSFWNECPLIQPSRAAFRCRPVADDGTPPPAADGGEGGTAAGEGPGARPPPPESPG